uniref:Acid-sensing ion channel 1 n=1 Tax=Sinocyclocheilus anshuiensis TaxID=1608454 RepID=A0A671QSY2_9TELE
MDIKTESEDNLDCDRPAPIEVFASRSTLHGISHMFSYERQCIKRCIWIMFFMGSFSFLVLVCVDRIKFYFQYPHVTKLDEVTAPMMAFPAITFCNLNAFRFSRVTRNDLYHAGELLALLNGSYSDLLFMGPLLGYEDNMAPGIPLAPEPDRQGSRFSLAEFFNRTRHSMEDMLLECKFAGKECGPEHWREIFTRYGKCYTFNSGQDGRPLLITMKGGMGNGLELMLDIQQDEYLPLTYLPPPWGDCKATPMDSDFFNTYSITACRIDCETRYLVENCNCRMVHMPGDAPYCTPEQYKECADPALDFLVERDNDYCVCDTPCNMTRYGKELSFVKIPSKASAKYLAKKYNKTEQYIAENILVLDIFFEALNFETIEQKKAYELAGLLGDIGGQMGLFIGASILTILELFDYLYEVIKYKLCHCAKKKHQRSNNNERGAVLSLDDVKRHAPCENLRTPSTYPANMLPHHPGQGNFEDFTC